MSVDFILRERELQALYDECLDTWGMDSQILMLAEEAGELVVATLHLLRSLKQETAFEQFIDELADIEVMKDEFYYYFRHRDLRNRVRARYDEKIQRLKRLLRGGE